MKVYFKIIVGYFLLAFLSVTLLTAKPRKIENIISKKASQKLYYQLTLAAIYQKDYVNNRLKSTQSNTQYRKNIQSLEKSIIVNADAFEPTVDVLIRISKGSNVENKYFINHKRIEGEKYSYFTATIKLSDLEPMSELDNVLAVEPSFITESLLDNSVRDIHADQVWSGNLESEISDKITGKNVFVGIIDKKPNINHITFLDVDKKSRFIEIAPFSNFTNTGNHGTSVAGIAAGSGAQIGNYKGIAYKSTLMWYPTKQNDLLNESNTILNAIDAMKKVANEKPLVINNSNGIFSGPRDGTLEVEYAINDLMQGNKIFVNAAGNQSNRGNTNSILPERYKTYPMHFQGYLSNNPLEYVEIRYHILPVDLITNLHNNTSKIEIWHENDIDVEIVDNDLISPEIRSKVGPGEFDLAWKFDEQSDDFISIINSDSNDDAFTEPNNSKSKITSIMFQSGDASFSSGEFKIRIYPHTKDDSGNINAYVCFNGPSISGFENGDDYQTVVSPGLSINVICVANHKKEKDAGNISASSSLGPIRNDSNDKISKPDISAPGECIISASNADNYSFTDNQCTNSGTSFSAPHVTGAIALLMQCFPQLNAIQVKEILQKSAGPISPSGNWQKNGTLTPEDRKYWGAGKLDILAAYKSMAGFSYERPYAYDENKYKSSYEANPNCGLPFGPVNYNWNNNTNHSYQKFTNGAIFCDNQQPNAYWLGEGIWNKWIALDGTQSRLGLPLNSEFEEVQNNSFATVNFENGKIFWDGLEAKVEYFVQPNFTATATEGAAPLPVQFTNLTRVDVGTVTSWLWDFGDGTTSTEQSPSHTYTLVGSFDVKLTLEYNSKSFQITVVDFITTFSTPSTTNIIRMEYFFDTDPGLGNAILIAITPSPYINITPKLSLADVSPGLHRLYIRTCDSNRKWSTIYSKPILVTTDQASTSIAKMEYFIDEKPESGIGTPLNFPAAKDVSVSKNLSLVNIAPGLHRIYFRAKDKTGRWSSIYSKPLLVTNQKSLAPIKKIEYFFDESKAGISSNTLSFSPSNDVTVSQQISTSGISTGLHRLYFKAQDETGRWSTLYSKPVLINNSSTNLPNLSRLEYFIDTDPGLNSGIALPFTASPDITLNPNIPLTGLSNGSHAIYFRAKDKNGLWSLPQYSAFTIENSIQDITLNTGWNIISAHVIPSSLDLKTIFQPLIDKGNLKKVIDETGKTIENLGAFGGWRNNIGNLNTAKGYKVNVTAASTLSLQGAQVQLPYDMALNAGWNIVSYPSASIQDAKALVQSLIDSGKLKKVMDEAGKTIENLGAFGGWRNNIGNFLPGKGYKINVTANSTLTIPANATKVAAIVPNLLSSSHFIPTFKGNGTDHNNINLINLQTSGLQTEDQIGVFDGNLCVGSATLGLEQLTEGTINIPVSANDELSETLNGFTEGHLIKLALSRKGQIFPLKLEPAQGNPYFEKNGSLIAKVSLADLTGIQITEITDQFRCYPNPFSDEISIEIQTTGQSKVTMEIYSIAGQRIKNLYSGTNIGKLILKWDGTNDSGQIVAPGAYLCKMNGLSKQLIFEGGKENK